MFACGLNIRYIPCRMPTNSVDSDRLFKSDQSWADFLGNRFVQISMTLTISLTSDSHLFQLLNSNIHTSQQVDNIHLVGGFKALGQLE